MKRVMFFVSTRKVGSRIEETVEFEDDEDEGTIQACYEDWVWEQLNSGWKEEPTPGASGREGE